MIYYAVLKGEKEKRRGNGTSSTDTKRKDDNMDKREFENTITPRVNNGIGGGVSPETWAEIELVYMNTNLGKLEVADCFWNHTGRWSRLAFAVKTKIETAEKAKLALQALEAARRALEEAQAADVAAIANCSEIEEAEIAEYTAACA